ncbi:MAG: hypothetical protein KKA62_03395 [Nanoarchaeota archaeon]|nr:hypothetical protein [Nanoarchaeota archaeon]MBU1644659.1 hypothetical protein [Nanoarchaeota archaeon]MBU1976970.1 hypothetical protein [Nanoarchaeota archaeon]
MTFINETNSRLENSELFLRWKENHQDSYLSHFFCPLDQNYKLKGSWEIGYYNPKDDKIVVFMLKEDGSFEMKKEDEVFKKPEDKVTGLNLEKVKISYEDALEIFKKNYQTFFPKALLGDGFIVLQNIEEKTLWNFTFVTKSLQFINLKINSEDGKVDSHQTVELVQK